MFDSFTVRGRVRSILKLLSEERKIILKGPLSDLNGIVERRDVLVERLVSEKVALTPAEIESIRQEAGRNQSLIKASLSGMKAAKTLLSEQQRAATTMGTYTISGKRFDPLQKSDGTDRMA